MPTITPTRPHSISFAVDAVTPAAELLRAINITPLLESRVDHKCLALSAPALPIVAAKHHPLIEAVGIAYAQHLPLTLSPDDIWLTIAQGFAHHIALNAETFRHRLVRHEGKQPLTAAIQVPK